jgi:hypothetical protein
MGLAPIVVSAPGAPPPPTPPVGNPVAGEGPKLDYGSRTTTSKNENGDIVRDSWAKEDGTGGKREIFSADGKSVTTMDGKTTTKEQTNGQDAYGAMQDTKGNGSIDSNGPIGEFTKKEAEMMKADGTKDSKGEDYTPEAVAGWLRGELADGKRGLNADGKAALSKDGTGGKFNGDVNHNGSIDNGDVEQYLQMLEQQASGKT